MTAAGPPTGAGAVDAARADAGRSGPRAAGGRADARPADAEPAGPPTGAGAVDAARADAGPARAEPSGPLAGLRVVEVGASLAAAFCGRILADLGATVVRGPAGPDSVFFARGKSTLDDAAARAAVAQADAVLESGELEPERLLAERPDLRVVSLTNFGRTGPLADQAGPEILAWARSGYMALTGDPDREPLTVPNQGAVQAAVNGVIGLLASLLTPAASARDRWIDVSIQESLAFHVAGAVADAAVAGVRVRRVGNRVAVAGGGGHNYTEVHRCRDGYVLCSVTSGAPVRQLLAMTDRRPGPDTAHLEAKPGAHVAELDELCGRWVADRSRDDVVAVSTRAGLHWAAVESPRAVLGSEHLAVRDFFGPDGVPRHPFRMRPAAKTAPAAETSSAGPTPAAETAPPGPTQAAETPAAETAPTTGPAPKPVAGRPLAGTTVVEIGTMVAGPYAAALLADLGATVVKVEPRDGDILRRSTNSIDRRRWFHECNRQKESVCLDLTQPEDVAVLHAMLPDAHAVVHNLRPGVAEKLGFDEATLRGVNPALTVVQVSAFGAVGPDGARKGTNSTVDAASGLAAVTGYPDGSPMRPGNIYCDLTSALYATVAVLAGLIGAREEGRGWGTDLAMVEVAAYGLGDVLATGRDPARRGNAPYRCLPTPDGRWVVTGVEGVPDAPVLEPEELLDDPQLAHRGFFARLTTGPGVPVPQLPVHRATQRAGAPELDEQGPARRVRPA